MIRKNLQIVLGLLLITAFLLSACGQQATPAPVEPEAPAATEAPAMTEAPAPSGEGITLRWRTRPDNQAEIEVYQKASDTIDGKLEGVALVYEPGGSETSSYQDVLKTEIAAGTAPDVFWIPGTDVAEFATRGLILNATDLAAATPDFSVDDFYPGPMFHLTFNPESNASGADSGALWGLPRDVSTFVLYLNLDLINEAGASDPRELAENGEWTWDAFLDVAQKVRGLGSDIYGYGANAWWGPYGVWLNSAGGGFFNEDRTACALDTPESLAGLEFERSLYQDYDVAVPYGEDSEPPFMAGRVGMFQNGRWATPGVRSNANFTWDAVELPTGPDGMGNWLFWGAYVINANTEHPEEAWQLVQELTSAEIQGMISELGTNIPSRVSQEALDKFLTFTPPDNNQAFLNGLAQDPEAEGPLWAGSWPEYDAVMGPAVASVLTGERTVDDFAASICAEANKAFTNPPVAQPPAPSGEEISLRWRTRPDNQAEIDVYQEASDTIDGKMEGVTLVYEPGGSETSSYQDVLKTEIAAGTAPDVFWIPGTDVAEFATRGLILNATDLAAATPDFSVDDFYPGPMFHLTFNPESNASGADSGALWGLPRDVSTFVLYLNLDLINEAGASDPRELAENGEWTWDAFLDVAQKVRGLGSDIYGYGANAWWGPYGVWLNSAGGGFFNEDRTACALDTPESLAGLEFERSLYQDYDVAVPYGEDSEPPFMAGRVGMFQNGRWATPGVRSNANFTWDAVELPTGPDGMGNWLFWGAYVINANTEHPEEAWQLVQELTSAEIQGMISELGTNIPSRVSQEALDKFLTFTPPDNNQAFLNGLAQDPEAEGPLWAGSWPEYDAVMGPAVASVLTGERTVDDFAASICDEVNKAFNP